MTLQVRSRVQASVNCEFELLEHALLVLHVRCRVEGLGVFGTDEGPVYLPDIQVLRIRRLFTRGFGYAFPYNEDPVTLS